MKNKIRCQCKKLMDDMIEIFSINLTANSKCPSGSTFVDSLGPASVK